MPEPTRLDCRSKTFPLQPVLVLLAVLLPAASMAADAGESQCPQMNAADLGAILKRFDPDLTGEAGSWQMAVAGRTLHVVTDENAGRMRIMTAVGPAGELSQEQLYRLMQANFESALDARYSIANGVVWSVFIHPLSPVSDAQLVSSLAQTVTLAETYGSTFSSGALAYGGGDHGSELFEQLNEKGTPL